MTRLLVVELRRLLSRRLVRMIVLAVFLTMTVISAVLAFRHTNDAGEARQRVTNEVIQQRAQGGFGFSCDNNSAPPGPIEIDPRTNEPILPPGCRTPTVAEEVAQRLQYEDPRFLFARDARGMVLGGMVVAALIAFLLSASAIGAEWNAGTFASLLTWEPRRVRVLVAKTAASVLAFTAVGALLIGYQLLSAAALAQTRGSFEGMTGQVTRDLASAVGRGIGVVALCAAAGAALAGIARSTAGAMAVLGGYLVVVELGLRNMLNGDTRWLLSTNAQALVAGRTTVYLPQPVRRADGAFLQPEVVITAAHAALVIGAAVLVVTVAHAVLLQRRDAN